MLVKKSVTLSITVSRGHTRDEPGCLLGLKIQLVPRSKYTPFLTNNDLMPYREIMAVCSDNHTNNTQLVDRRYSYLTLNPALLCATA
jgi:hypothetical protein